MHSIENRCYGTGKYTVCRRVRAAFSQEVLQAGAVKGLITSLPHYAHPALPLLPPPPPPPCSVCLRRRHRQTPKAQRVSPLFDRLNMELHHARQDLACAAVFLLKISHARDCSHSAVCDSLVSDDFARDSLDSLVQADHRPVNVAATLDGLHNGPLSERLQRRWTSYGNGGAKACHKVRQSYLSVMSRR